MYDRIDDIEFDVDSIDLDEGGVGQVATLRLWGDFSEECDSYLKEEGLSLRFTISRDMAEKLVERIAPYLHG